MNVTEINTEERKKQIGQVVMAARLAKGWSRQTLAEKMGYTGSKHTNANVFGIESGKRYIPPEKLRIVRELLDLTWDDIIP